MLVLSRKEGETIIFSCGAEKVKLTVTNLTGSRVKLGFEANKKVNIVRGELNEDREREERRS